MKLIDKFRNYVKSVEGDKYTVLSFNNETKKYKMRHNKCGYEYEVNANAFKGMHRRCPKCNGGVKYTNDEFIAKFNEVSHGKFELLSPYINGHTKILIKHIKCGSTFESLPADFIFRHKDRILDSCINCNGLKNKNTDIFKKEVYNLVGDEYTVLGEYVNNRQKILMHHNAENCKGGKDNKFYVSPKTFITLHSRCPYCKASTGEKTIRTYLQQHKYNFSEHVRDLNCLSKSGRNLEFDFKINLNDNDFILLEYDGRLHFEPWNVGEEHELKLQKQQENDAIKDEFCKNNNYKLYRISYKDDIIKTLTEILPSTTIESITE